MKRKFLLKFTIISVLSMLIASQALAAWYSSTITLPRNGWWYTVERQSTQNTQQTKVTKPKYDVVSNIVNTNNDQLSSNKTHASGKTITQSHTTNSKGSSIKGAFRSSVINQFTNTVNLSWEP
ncbi:hypothetical protein ABE099_07790 [Paenibacillus turicensis]|uniref:hypothetical protein n=1 Tax=Paenibacillus turicensis TaxID=160487 RepID=UPI003D2C17B0